MRWMKTWPAIVIGVMLGTIVAVTADDWLTYSNDRYGTTIDYPASFKPMPPPDNDDGRRFKSADGAEFAVFASYNAFDFNLAKFRDDTVQKLDAGSIVTYQAHGDDWFVISGTKGDAIFTNGICCPMAKR
ncbi:MAG: hypothetical protein WB764_30745 [Xanthobacteraceae bacterium]